MREIVQCSGEKSVISNIPIGGYLCQMCAHCTPLLVCTVYITKV